MITKLFNSGYVCGALIGNGVIKADKKTARYSILLESKNKEFMSNVAERMSAFFEKPVKQYERAKNKLKLYSVVHYLKTDILKFVDEFGLKKGAYTWSVPKQCYEDKHFRKGFLQGYFDAKARIRVRYRKRQKKGDNIRFDKVRNLRISSVNKKGLSEIKLLLQSFGIGSTISQSNSNNILDIEGKRRISLFRDKINFGIDMKRKELEKTLEFKSGL